MKFVVDAQLPRRLARELAAAGHDAVRTSIFPNGVTLTIHAEPRGFEGRKIVWLILRKSIA
jgi:hypothetical protein